MEYRVGDRVWMVGGPDHMEMGTIVEVKVKTCEVRLDKRPKNMTLRRMILLQKMEWTNG